MKNNLKQYFILLITICTATSAVAQNFELMPMYDIRVKSDKLTYSDISVETSEGMPVLRNEIPQDQQFSLVVHNPGGFRDSAGWVLYGLEYSLMRENGEVVMHTPDIFKGTGIAADTTLNSVSLNNTFNTETKPGTKLIIQARLYDRNGSGTLNFEYHFTVISGSRKLPLNAFIYNEKDSRGMRSTSVGLHYNFFEFKGLEGNHFLYRINKRDNLNINLKGFDGWRVKDERVAPQVDIEILDIAGNPIEAAQDITLKSIGETMPSDKKELNIEYKPETKLASGQFYFANLKIHDRNSKKSEMGVVIKFYVED